MKLFSRKSKKPVASDERLEKIRSDNALDGAPIVMDQSPLLEKSASSERSTGLASYMQPRERAVHKIHFRTLASDTPNKDLVLDKELESAQLILRKVYAPSSPILDLNYFAGRVNEMARAVSAIENERMHLVIHGKRGLGKTSFSNTLSNIASQAGYIVCNTSCSQNSTFSEIFRSFLSEIPILFDQGFMPKHGAESQEEAFDTLLPEGDFSPKELTKVLLRLTTTRVLFVIDEVDRNQNPDFKSAVIETIKNFSDNCVRANLILIGATDTVDELIGLNESVRRNVAGIPIKVFSDEEVNELFNLGEEVSNVRFPKPIRKQISELSRNVPHSLRLLCLHTAQSAVSKGRWTVNGLDLSEAITHSKMDAQALLDRDLLDLMHSRKSNQLETFLFALASTDFNEDSEFYAEKAAQTQREQTDEKVTALSIGSRLSMLCKSSPPILSKREYHHKVLYKFCDPTFGFYLRLLQADKGDSGK